MVRSLRGVNLRHKYKSETFKHGEPSNHALACRMVKAWYRSYVTGCIVEKDWPVYFNKTFMDKEKLDYPYHEYDLAFFEYVDGGPGGSYSKLHTVVEIDGERHQSKLVKINDGIAQKYIQETYKYAKFIRLNKLDCLVGDVLERNEYFRRMFGLPSVTY